MYFCLRVDLDYVPWDTPDAQEFGHGEPATFLRLLDLSRGLGVRLHFFASNRVLRAFASTAETVLNEGHDLDWFCKHPEEGLERRAEAEKLFKEIGHTFIGLAVKGTWPPDAVKGVGSELRFISATSGKPPTGVRLLPVETKSPREALRAGTSLRAWTDSIKSLSREHASRNVGLTVAVRPQVLAKYDPRLQHIKEILEFAGAVGLEIKSLRQVL